MKIDRKVSVTVELSPGDVERLYAEIDNALAGTYLRPKSGEKRYPYLHRIRRELA